jgi:NADPH:quinone reductase-like Zn-dependent oxidoreductase
MSIPTRMTAVELLGHGGPDLLRIRDNIPIPELRADQVLIKVGASSVNNTDINTRTGWYTRESSAGDTSWSGQGLQFPRIQGADCCGRIIAVGAAVDASRIGERVLVRTMQAPEKLDGHLTPITLGSEIDGAFAQFIAVRASEAFVVNSLMTDVELATFPCAYSTAEGLLTRAHVGAERIVVTGASGGVGSAVIQLAVLRGTQVIALASERHHDALLALGAEQVLDRNVDIVSALGESSVDAVIDVVGGSRFPDLLRVLRPQGRYATSGAVAGAEVRLDLRDLYLKDLTLLGCTFHPPEVFNALIANLETGRLRPLVADVYSLSDIHEAQERFAAKDFVGKIALVPPPTD